MTSKIKRDILISEYEHGGLKMIDVSAQAQKSNWVRKNGSWFFDLQLRDFGRATLSSKVICPERIISLLQGIGRFLTGNFANLARNQLRRYYFFKETITFTVSLVKLSYASRELTNAM